MNDMEYLDDDNMDEDQLEKENDSNEDMWEKAEDQKNVSDKSKPDDVPEGNEEKSSEQIINNDNVSDTNPVDGEMGTSKKSEPVVVIKYGCKKYKARHAHKRLYTVLPKYSKIQVLPGITSCRLVKDNKQAIELNIL